MYFDKNANKVIVKTRDLPTLDFLETLQLEYICAELRKKIYAKVGDKSYYGILMNRKKIKIDDISLKNQKLPTIFNSTKEKERLYLKIYLERGLANFLYKDESNKIIFRSLDLSNYYSINSDVKIYLENNNSIFIGKISSINLKAEVVEVIDRNDSSFFGVFDMKNVTRIL